MSIKNRLNRIEGKFQPKYRIPKEFALYGTGFIASNLASLLEEELRMRKVKGWIGRFPPEG